MTYRLLMYCNINQTLTLPKVEFGYKFEEGGRGGGIRGGGGWSLHFHGRLTCVRLILL